MLSESNVERQLGRMSTRQNIMTGHMALTRHKTNKTQVLREEEGCERKMTECCGSIIIASHHVRVIKSGR